MASAAANYRLPTTPREVMCGGYERHSSKTALVLGVQITLKEEGGCLWVWHMEPLLLFFLSDVWFKLVSFPGLTKHADKKKPQYKITQTDRFCVYYMTREKKMKFSTKGSLNCPFVFSLCFLISYHDLLFPF